MNHGVDAARAAPPDVPGLVLDRLLGAGRFGPVWQGLDLATGRPVAVRIGPPGPDPEAAAREAALLRRLDHENVVPMLSMVDLPDGSRAIVGDLVVGGSLAALVDRRGELPSAEAATVAVGVARGLGDVHARGFVHGAVTPNEVLLDANGRPRLTGVGVGALLAPSHGAPAEPVYPAPADDVAALGEVLRYVLRGGVPGPCAPGPLTAVVDACTAPDPAERPTAEDVARLVLEAVPPQPVTLLEAYPSPAAFPDSTPAFTPALTPDLAVGAPVRGIPPSIARRAAAMAEGRPEELDGPDGGPGWAGARRVLGVAGAVVAGSVVLAGALALALRHDDAPRRPVGQPVAAPPPGAPALVAVLAAGRARALESGSEQALGVVDAPGSTAMADDTALVRRLQASGVRLAGLSFAVSDVHVVTTGAAGTTVEARVATGAYEQVRADGAVERRVPAATARTVRLTLVPTSSGWRISSSS